MQQCEDEFFNQNTLLQPSYHCLEYVSIHQASAEKIFMLSNFCLNRLKGRCTRKMRCSIFGIRVEFRLGILLAQPSLASLKSTRKIKIKCISSILFFFWGARIVEICSIVKSRHEACRFCTRYALWNKMWEEIISERSPRN